MFSNLPYLILDASLSAHIENKQQLGQETSSGCSSVGQH